MAHFLVLFRGFAKASRNLRLSPLLCWYRWKYFEASLLVAIGFSRRLLRKHHTCLGARQCKGQVVELKLAAEPRTLYFCCNENGIFSKPTENHHEGLLIFVCCPPFEVGVLSRCCKLSLAGIHTAMNTKRGIIRSPTTEYQHTCL